MNINVSVLYSEETISESKNNSLTFNYSPDSTSRMNNTKSQFNSAKKTLKSNLNKSNSINYLLTENTFTFNTNNSNYNTLNSNCSKDKKESPGNPYLMEKITSLLNQSNKNQLNIFKNSTNDLKLITNRDIIKNEFNNVNVQNNNYTNADSSPKNFDINANALKQNKLVSENMNKNLLFIMNNNLNRKLNDNSDKKLQKSSDSNKNYNIDDNLSKCFNSDSNTEKFINKNQIMNENKRKLDSNDYLSPPSSKKRLEDKFYNYTENKNQPKISNFVNDEILIKQTLDSKLQTERQNEFNKNYQNAQTRKFDFSRYNYKSQDLTDVINQRKKLKENNINNNKTDNAIKIISNESNVENSKSHSRDKSDNTIGFSKSNNTCNLNLKENLLDKMRVSDKKIFINAFEDNKNLVLIKKSHKEGMIYNDKVNEEKNFKESKSIEKDEKEPKSENLPLKISSVEKSKKKGNEKNTLIMRDIKSLHLITQKALTNKNNINLKGDSVDQEKKKLFINSNSTKKALFIDDNSDMPVGIGKSQDALHAHKNNLNYDINYENIICKTDYNIKSPNSNSFTLNNSLSNYNISEKDRKQIINIININNNYNIGNFNLNLKDDIYSITNPNSNFKENNSKNKYTAFFMSKESNKSKNISNSHCNTHKSKNRINSSNNKTNNSKNISAFSNLINTNLKSKNEKKNVNYESSTSNYNSNNVSSQNNLNSSNLIKQKISLINSNNNISSLKNLSNINTPNINGKYKTENKNITFNNETNNLTMSSINEFLNTSKEKNVPNTSKNFTENNNFPNKFLKGISSSNNMKQLVSENKIKDILKSYKKEENTKNKFIKISSYIKK